MIRLPRRPKMQDVKVGTLQILDRDLETFKKYCEFQTVLDQSQPWDIAELFYVAAKRLVEGDPVFQHWQKTGKIEEVGRGRRKKSASGATQ